MKQSSVGSFFAVLLILFVGCVPYQKIVKTEFPQGERELKNRNVVGRNIRDLRVLDEYATDIEVNALWMSDEVREEYVDMVTRKKALDMATRADLLEGHIEKNDNTLTFYVFVYTPESHRSDLHDKDPFWSLYLKMPDGKKRHATSIKEVDIVDLDPTIKEFFGHRVTPYKRAFVVDFPVKAFSPSGFIGSDMKMHLVVRSTKAKGRLTWDLGEEKKKKHTSEDYYWIEYL